MYTAFLALVIALLAYNLTRSLRGKRRSTPAYIAQWVGVAFFAWLGMAEAWLLVAAAVLLATALVDMARGRNYSVA